MWFYGTIDQPPAGWDCRLYFELILVPGSKNSFRSRNYLGSVAPNREGIGMFTFWISCIVIWVTAMDDLSVRYLCSQWYILCSGYTTFSGYPKLHILVLY